MSFSTLRALRDMAINCPNDISVLGYDGMDIGNFTTPRLTTMSRPVEVMGHRAVKLLLSDKHEKMKKHQIVKARLEQRDSCRRI